MIHNLGGVFLFGVSSFCYFHQIAMISVIKLRRVSGLVDLHGVNFVAFVACVLRVWFECCDFGSIVPLYGWFNSSSIDGWCFFWYRFILLLLCFLF
jgi:hypothetical protein